MKDLMRRQNIAAAKLAIHHIALNLYIQNDSLMLTNVFLDLKRRGVDRVGIDVQALFDEALKDYRMELYPNYLNHADMFDTAKAIMALVDILDGLNNKRTEGMVG